MGRLHLSTRRIVFRWLLWREMFNVFIASESELEVYAETLRLCGPLNRSTFYKCACIMLPKVIEYDGDGFFVFVFLIGFTHRRHLSADHWITESVCFFLEPAGCRSFLYIVSLANNATDAF